MTNFGELKRHVASIIKAWEDHTCLYFEIG